MPKPRSWPLKSALAPQVLRGSKDPKPARSILALAQVSAAWLAVALVSAAQGQFLAAYLGRAQLWWPSFGYAAAIFSVWALLTPLVWMAAQHIARSDGHAKRLVFHALALPAVTALHVALFAGVYWPLYGDASQGPISMMRPVLLANLDKAVFAYVAIAVVEHLSRRASRSASSTAKTSGSLADAGLWIRNGAARRFVPYEEIDWIGAAGDYAEVHAGPLSLLADRSLADLTAALPSGSFARIHRGAIVRLDRIRHIRAIGRGDASIVLRSGDTLRLSRRYRDNLMGLINAPDPGQRQSDPA